MGTQNICCMKNVITLSLLFKISTVIYYQLFNEMKQCALMTPVHI